MTYKHALYLYTHTNLRNTITIGTVRMRSFRHVINNIIVCFDFKHFPYTKHENSLFYRFRVLRMQLIVRKLNVSIFRVRNLIALLQ